MWRGTDKQTDTHTHRGKERERQKERERRPWPLYILCSLYDSLEM